MAQEIEERDSVGAISLFFLFVVLGKMAILGLGSGVFGLADIGFGLSFYES